MFFNTKFILASKSQSRFFILKNNKLSFLQVKPKCNEDKIKKIFKKSKPKKLSLILAESKAKSLKKKYKEHLVVGCDTTIELNKKLIEKAKNLNEAKNTLTKMSGKKLAIFSSLVCVCREKVVWKTTQKTTIKMRKLTNKEIDQYLKVTKKAILSSVGCFQIEKEGPNIIENIKGDFFNVMGLPLFPFLKFLKEFKIKK